MKFLSALWFLLLATSSFGADAFEKVKDSPFRERVGLAQDIYNKDVKLKDSAFAINAIQKLIVLSGTLQDKSLECFANSLLADQYARIGGLNERSTRLHKRAITLAEEYKLPLMVGICNYRLGRYYYSFKNYPFAFEYLLRADHLFQEAGYKEVPDIDEMLYFMGSIYYETGNYEKAENFLLEVLQLKKISQYVQKQSLNTLALIKRQQNDTLAAENYFKRTLDAALAHRDSAWIGISLSNLGALYFANADYGKAYPLLEQGANICLARKQWGDAYSDLLFIARMDLNQNRIGPASAKIAAALKLHPLYYTLAGRKNLYETQAIYYEKTGQPDRALVQQRKLMAVMDSLATSKNQKAYREIQLRIETEKHLADLDKLESEKETDTLKRNAVIAVLAMLLMVLLLLYRNYRMKARNTAAQLGADKLLAEEKLKYARQLLQNFTENARQKNELIEQFATELEQLKGNLPGHPVYEERIKNFDKLIRFNLLTEEEWNDFRDLFDKVYKGFFARLLQKLPSLSPADTRLISLLRLGLNEQEMARMMGMDTMAISQARQRLRSSFEERDPSLTLEAFIEAI